MAVRIIRKVDIMAILLTNGTRYIALTNSGAVKKVDDIKKAYNFYCVERAIKQKNKAPKKCAGYYFIDTDIKEDQETKEDSTLKEKKKKSTVKRKSFSARERLTIYRKTKGHCYLCGEFVDFDSFEVEHKVPLSKGGTNDLDNLFCSCHCCNSIKQDIYPKDFMEKISQIFMYQMQIQYGNSLKWKIINNELRKML